MANSILEIIVRARDEASATIAAANRKIGQSFKDNEGHLAAFATGTAAASRTLATGLVGAGVAAAGLGTVGIKLAGDLEQTEIAFKGILGSGQKAQAFLKELQGFAARTPFEFPDLARASKNLLAVGFSAREVLPTMTKIGNVAATLGVGAEGIDSVVRALGQMRGKGKASAEELQQISEAVPGFSAIGAIAKEMGISTATAFKQMEKGAIPADQAITAILAGMEKFPGAAGAMDRQSQTLNGMLSTLKDTASLAAVEFLKTSGIFDAIKGAVAAAIPNLARFGSFLSDKVIPAVKDFFAQRANVIGFLTALSVLLGVIAVQVVVATWPVIALTVALAALGVGVATAVKAWDTNFGGIRDKTHAVADAVVRLRDVAVGFFDLFIRGDFTGAFGRALGVHEDDALIDKLFAAREAILGLMQTAVTFFHTVVTFFGTTLPATIQTGLNAVVSGLLWFRDNWTMVLGYIVGFVATLPIKIPLLMLAAIVNSIAHLPQIVAAWGSVIGQLVNNWREGVNQWVAIIRNINWGALLASWRDNWLHGFDQMKNIALGLYNFLVGLNWGAILTSFGKGIGNAVIGFVEGAIKGAAAGIPVLSDLAKNLRIPRFERGTPSAPGGLAWVGERGPELVNLPRGSQVFTNQQSRQLSGNQGVTININGDIINQSNIDWQGELRAWGWQVSMR